MVRPVVDLEARKSIVTEKSLIKMLRDGFSRLLHAGTYECLVFGEQRGQILCVQRRGALGAAREPAPDEELQRQYDHDVLYNH